MRPFYPCLKLSRCVTSDFYYLSASKFDTRQKCIPIHYRLSFQLFINSPPRWTNLAVLQTMLKLLPRSRLKITINFITIV